jgi:hypothetical protein
MEAIKHYIVFCTESHHFHIQLECQTHLLSVTNTSQLPSGQLLTGILNSGNARYKSVPLFYPYLQV